MDPSSGALRVLAPFNYEALVNKTMYVWVLASSTLLGQTVGDVCKVREQAACRHRLL